MFQDVITTEALFKASLILFFNKIDLLEERLKTKPGREAFKVLFPIYSKYFSSQDAANLIRIKFEDLFRKRFNQPPTPVDFEPITSQPFESVSFRLNNLIFGLNTLSFGRHPDYWTT